MTSNVNAVSISAVLGRNSETAQAITELQQNLAAEVTRSKQEDAKHDASILAESNRAKAAEQEISGNVTELSAEVFQVSESMTGIQNTGENKVQSGKVWTSTANGAEWKTPTVGTGKIDSRIVDVVDSLGSEIPFLSTSGGALWNELVSLLMEFIDGSSPEEPESILVDYSGTIATINNLKNNSVSYSGTIVTIGG